MEILVHMQSRILTEALVGLLGSITPQHQVHRLGSTALGEEDPPDVVICDGSNCTGDRRCRWPDSKVLLIDTGMKEQEMYCFMVSRQIDGILTTDMPPEMLAKALAAVKRGEFWLPRRNFRNFFRQAGSQKNGRLPELKEKDRRLLELVARGCTNKETAEELHLSEQTIKSHVSRLFRLLNVTNRAQLVRLVVDHLS
jgi:LuxR family transcriptional regulator, positive regulator of biofilm formation